MFSPSIFSVNALCVSHIFVILSDIFFAIVAINIRLEISTKEIIGKRKSIQSRVFRRSADYRSQWRSIVESFFNRRLNSAHGFSAVVFCIPVYL